MVLKPSTSLAILLLLFHLLAACVVFLTTLPGLPKLVLFLSIVSSLAYYLARDALLLMPHSWHEVSLTPSGVSVALRDGSRFAGQVAGRTVVGPYFIVLGICLENRRPPAFRVLFPDAMERGRFRELCVRLRFA